MFSARELRALLSKLDIGVRTQVSRLMDEGRSLEASRLLAEHLGSGQLATEVVASMQRLTEGV